MRYTDIYYDSRKVTPGSIFVAIPGQRFDAAEFVPQAIEKGAKLIVAEKEIPVPAGVDLIKVENARIALAKYACEIFDNPSKKLTLIGVTGTNGKTTITYLIKSILETAGFKTGIIGTITNSLTTPESSDLQRELAAMVDKGITHCVMEVSSHALAQERVYGCKFKIAIFTNLTHDHLDFHKNMDSYLAAKRKLFEMLAEDGIAIVNVDDPYFSKIADAVKGEVIAYGIHQAKHELRSTKQNEFDTHVSDIYIGSGFMRLKVNSFDIETKLIGLHNVYNIAAAYQCALSLGIDQRTIKKGIEALKQVEGRGEEIEIGKDFKVIVDFAHSPDALQKLVETYRPLTKGKVILVYGCPGDRDLDKRPIMGEIAAQLADITIITTDDPHSEDPLKIINEIAKGDKKAEKIIDRKAAIEKALLIAQSNDIVLIAGRGHEKYQDFNGEKIALDDRAVVRSFAKTVF